MSFQQGLSGLNGAAQSLDVIGNNIANASTVGFKGSTAQFADLYANSLNGANGNQAGIGVKVSKIAQQFTQGNVESSANPLDIAINGAGFFRTIDSGTIEYSRNGQFSLDKNGFMENAQAAKLTGYMANTSGNILAGAPVPLKIDNSDLSPVATTSVNSSLNLDSRSVAPVTTPFSASDPTSYNKQTSIDVFDSLGNSHVLSTYYVKAGPGTWDMYTANDGTEISSLKTAAAAQSDPTTIAARAQYMTDAAVVPPVAATIASDTAAYSQAAGAAVTAAATAAGASPAQLARIAATYDVSAGTDVGSVVGATPDSIDAAIAAQTSVPASKTGTLVFDQNGALSTPGMAAVGQTLPLTITLPIFPNTGSSPTLTMTMSLTGTTQFGAITSEKTSTQDGFTAGHLTSFSAGADGVILGQYSNGQSHALGQLVLANFANPNGLTPLGNNAWAETSSSGVALVGVPGSGSLGALQSSAVEGSNVDLTAELVNMITAQRAYQANAQTIKTEDQVMQTLVNLR